MTTTLKQLRAQAVQQSLFDATTVSEAVARLGFVQADPIQAPARAQDLILRQRVPGYRAGDLERAYANAGIEEDVLHVYGFMPTATLDLMHPRAQAWDIEHEHSTLVDQLLSFVASNGLTSHRDLEAVLGSARARSGWGNQAKVTTLLLDALRYRGKLRVARRNGNERFYTVVERPPPVLSPEERLRQLVLLITRLYAPLSQRTLRELVSRLGYGAPGLEGRRTIVKDMLASGELAQAEVDGLPYIWLADASFEPHDDGRLRLLAPFDPIVYDRARFEHVWGWPYRFEAYTPTAKRKWGYYALPMLWRDRVIGWANVSYKEHQLHAQLGFVQRRPAGKDFKRALDDELARMTDFLTTQKQETQ